MELKQYILNVLNKSDGFIIPNEYAFHNIDIDELFDAIYELIDDEIIVRRNYQGLAFEYVI